MSEVQQTGRRRQQVRSASHSVRCTDELWESAKARADDEGVTMNYVISEILEGYARKLMDLPEVTKIYSATRPFEGDPDEEGDEGDEEPQELLATA